PYTVLAVRVLSGHFAISGRCPLYPQKLTLELSRVMSALCQKQTFNFRVRCDLFAAQAPGRSDTFFRPAGLASQHRSEIGNRFDNRGRLEPQFLRDLGGAALNPEGVQPGRRGAINVPGIRRDKAELGICDFQALRRKIVDPRADFENLDLFDANDFVKKIADTCALRRGL